MSDFWVCAQCQEKIEPQFEYCWNCGTNYDGQPDPHFVSQRESTQPAEPPTFPRLFLFIQMVWFLICAVSVFTFALVADQNLPETWANHLAATLFLFLSGILLGVFVNVGGQLYWITRDHFFPESKINESNES